MSACRLQDQLRSAIQCCHDSLRVHFLLEAQTRFRTQAKLLCDVLRTVPPSNFADSSKMRVVCGVTSEFAPPITPASATGFSVIGDHKHARLQLALHIIEGASVLLRTRITHVDAAAGKRSASKACSG